MKTWLIASTLAAAALAGCGSTAGSPAPKNVIFFLGDGMGMTTQTAARIYKVGEDGELTMDTLPETAFVKTYSNNAQVTDSAPSMAAYMTGVKMNNEVISMTADTSAFDVVTGKDYLNGTDSTCPTSGNGKPVTTLLELAKAAGMGTGAVTTVPGSCAAPVSFSFLRTACSSAPMCPSPRSTVPCTTRRCGRATCSSAPPTPTTRPGGGATSSPQTSASSRRLSNLLPLGGSREPRHVHTVRR